MLWIVLCDFRVNVTLDYNLNIVFRRLVHKVYLRLLWTASHLCKIQHTICINSVLGNLCD